MRTLRDLKLRLSAGDTIDTIVTDAAEAASLRSAAADEYRAAREAQRANPADIEAAAAAREAGQLLAAIDTHSTTLSASAAELDAFDALATPTETATVAEGPAAAEVVETTVEPAPERELIAASGVLRQVPTAADGGANLVTDAPARRDRGVRTAAIATGGDVTAPGQTLDRVGQSNRLRGMIQTAPAGVTPFLRQSVFGQDVPRIASGMSPEQTAAVMDHYDQLLDEQVERHGSHEAAARTAAGFGCFAPTYDTTIEMCFTSGSPVFDAITKIPADNCEFGYYQDLPLERDNNAPASPSDSFEWTPAMQADCNSGAGVPCEVYDCSLKPVTQALKRFARCFTYADSAEKCAPTLLAAHEQRNGVRWEKAWERYLLDAYVGEADAASQVFQAGTTGAPINGGAVAIADVLLSALEGSGMWDGRNSGPIFDLILPDPIRRRMNLEDWGVGERQPINNFADEILSQLPLRRIIGAMDDPTPPNVAGSTYPKTAGGTVAAPVDLGVQQFTDFWAILAPASWRMAWDGITDWGLDKQTNQACFQFRHQYSTWALPFNRSACYQSIAIKFSVCFGHSRYGTIVRDCVPAPILKAKTAAAKG